MSNRAYWDFLNSEFTGGPRVRTQSGSGTIAIDSNYGTTVVTLTGAATIATPSGAPIAGEPLTVIVVQDATGGRAVSWGAGYKNPPSWSAGTAGQRALASFNFDGAGWQFRAGASAFT